MHMRLLTMWLALSMAAVGLLLVADHARADSAGDAAAHFDAGVLAFQQQRFADAARDFELSYRAKPAYQVLYNLGSVYVALGRTVEAIDTLERYLRQGGADLSVERRTEVERELALQRSKVGQLEIDINIDDAETLLDAQLLERGPLHRRVIVAAGRHVLQVVAQGFQPYRQELTVSAGELVQFAPTLVRILLPAPSVSAANARDVGFGQRVAGYSVGGAGLVIGAVGVAMMARGQALHFDAVDKAKAGDRPEAERMESRADRKKMVGYTLTATGGAAFLAGIVLLLSAPRGLSASAAATKISPWLSAGTIGLAYEGTLR